MSALSGHFSESRKFSSSGIVNLGGICFAVANPAANDEDFARRQQNGSVTDARDGHVPSGPKFSGDQIVEFGGAIKILIAPHAANDENFAVGQQRSCVART